MKRKLTYFHLKVFTGKMSLIERKNDGYQSGQMGQTVTLLSQDFEGSNPSPPTPIEKHFNEIWKFFCLKQMFYAQIEHHI